jgi:tight adherence protein B
MSTLLAVLLVAVALVMALASRRERSGKMQRLRHLVVKPKRLAGGEAEDSASIQRFLPRNVVRNLHLLGIAADAKNGVLFFATGTLLAMGAWLYAGFPAGVAVASLYSAIAIMMLNLLGARRVAELGALLPSFFDRVRQMLIVGNSLPTAFTRTVQDAQPRLQAFFAPALRRMSNGASCAESIRQSAEDIDLYEMRLFAAAVATNMRFGGSLTHSLNNLVGYLSKRASIERELRANTAQIRFSAWILGLLPILVAGLIVFQNRDYARWFIVNPAGKHMLLYSIVSQIVGACFMRATVRTKF